jgi:hypothetical protein
MLKKVNKILNYLGRIAHYLENNENKNKNTTHKIKSGFFGFPSGKYTRSLEVTAPLEQ